MLLVSTTLSMDSGAPITEVEISEITSLIDANGLSAIVESLIKSDEIIYKNSYVDGGNIHSAYLFVSQDVYEQKFRDNKTQLHTVAHLTDRGYSIVVDTRTI